MNNSSQVNTQQNLMYQSQGNTSSKPLIPTLQNNETDNLQSDDYNIPHETNATTNNGMISSRQQQIQTKRSNNYNQINHKSEIPFLVQNSLPHQNQLKTIFNKSSFEKEDDAQSQFSQQLIQNQTSSQKKRIKMDNISSNGNTQMKQSFTFPKQDTVENISTHEQSGNALMNKLQILRSINSNDEENKVSNNNSVFENRNESLKNPLGIRTKKREASFGVTLVKRSPHFDDTPESPRSKDSQTIVKFSEENVIHNFEYSEKVEFIAQFMQEQRDFMQLAKDNQGQQNQQTKKGILKRKPKLRPLSKSQQLISNLDDEDISQNSETPSTLVQSRRRQIVPLPQLSIFSAKPVPEKEAKKIKKGRRASESKIFGSLKGSYEKDNYIKRLSSIQHLNIERLHQLLEKKENLKIKYQRIFLSIFRLIQNILSLKLIKLEFIQNTSSIIFYDVALNYFRMFLNFSFTGFIFFLYCYFQINELSTLIQFPIISSENESNDRNDFLTQETTLISHLGIILQVLIIIFILKQTLSDSCLFQEKQSVRLIFNQIKWNGIFQERNNYMKQKHKLYDKIMEDIDIHEGIYPQVTTIFLILGEITLLIFNIACIYFLMDDHQITDTLSTISFFSSYSLLTHLVIGLIIRLLIEMNEFIIEWVYKISPKMSFYHSERFMMQVLSFNTISIYILFVYKHIALFNENLNFNQVHKKSSTPVILLVQSQIGFILSFTLFDSLKTLSIYILHSFELYKNRNQHKNYFNNRIYDTNYTNLFDDKQKQLSINGDTKLNSLQINDLNNKINQNKDPLPISNNMNITPPFQPSNPNNNSDIQQYQLPLTQKFNLNSNNNPNNNKTNLIFKSSYFCKRILNISMINCSILLCIFTYPLIFPFGFVINFILILFLYLETKIIIPQRLYSFLTSNEFNSFTNNIIYTMLMIIIGFNILIGLSNLDNSNVIIQESLFSSGLDYLFDNDIINKIFYIITMPYSLYAIIIYLLTLLYQLSSSHNHQFNNFKASISNLRMNPTQNPPLSSSRKGDIVFNINN